MAVATNIKAISCDPFGNYVAQQVIEVRTPHIPPPPRIEFKFE